MDIFESRTSVRAFTDEPVAKSQVMALLRAAMLARRSATSSLGGFTSFMTKASTGAL